MAIFTLQRPIPTVVPQAPPGPPAGAPPPPGEGAGAAPGELTTVRAAAAVDKLTAAQDGKAVHPETSYLAAAGVAILLGIVAGTWIFDNWASGVTFTPPDGVNTLALFYIIAQVIERLQEPFTPFIKAPAVGDNGEAGSQSRKDERTAKAELEKAVARAERRPSPENSRVAANKKRTVDQIRANATVLLFGSSSLLAMLLVGYMKADLVRTVGVSGSAVWVDVAITGVAVGAGTKPLHDLISNLKESKEKKQDPQGTG